MKFYCTALNPFLILRLLNHLYLPDHCQACSSTGHIDIFTFHYTTVFPTLTFIINRHFKRICVITRPTGVKPPFSVITALPLIFQVASARLYMKLCCAPLNSLLILRLLNHLYLPDHCQACSSTGHIDIFTFHYTTVFPTLTFIINRHFKRICVITRPTGVKPPFSVITALPLIFQVASARLYMKLCCAPLNSLLILRLCNYNHASTCRCICTYIKRIKDHYSHNDRKSDLFFY